MFRLKIRRFSGNWEFWIYSKEMYYSKKGCVEEKRDKSGATTGSGFNFNRDQRNEYWRQSWSGDKNLKGRDGKAERHKVNYKSGRIGARNSYTYKIQFLWNIPTMNWKAFLKVSSRSPCCTWIRHRFIFITARCCPARLIKMDESGIYDLWKIFTKQRVGRGVVAKNWKAIDSVARLVARLVLLSSMRHDITGGRLENGAGNHRSIFAKPHESLEVWIYIYIRRVWNALKKSEIFGRSMTNVLPWR